MRYRSNKHSNHSSVSLPKLRQVGVQSIVHQGRHRRYLKDPLELSDRLVLISDEMLPILSLCDGSHAIEDIKAAYMRETGLDVSVGRIQEIIEYLDKSLLLENEAFTSALENMLGAYRQADFRTPSHAKFVYPDTPDELAEMLDRFYRQVPVPSCGKPAGDLIGLISPHIDYARGHQTYAQLWQSTASDLDDIELVIIFGTDHAGGLGMLTPTTQNYSTPFGVLQTDTDAISHIASVLGPEKAFEEEFHHIREHSIELAAVWMHHAMREKPLSVVPILCGSFNHFILGAQNPRDDEDIGKLITCLREIAYGRRTLVVAAGDLAHVGPAFGDLMPVDEIGMNNLAEADKMSLDAIQRCDADSFFDISCNERDTRRLCGLPPIYLTLRYLSQAEGVCMAYDQCSADANGESFVSIVGALLYGESGR